jgi:hypothetical protein
VQDAVAVGRRTIVADHVGVVVFTVPKSLRLQLARDHVRASGVLFASGRLVMVASLPPAAGNGDVLWVENGIELLCFNGTTWQQVPRVWHDKSKA